MKYIVLLTGLFFCSNSAWSESAISYVQPNSVQVESQRVNPRISRILQREAQAQTVPEALSVKRQGFRFVRSLWDFAQLTEPAVPNPSEAYLEGISGFIVTHLPEILNMVVGFDVYALSAIESNTYYVKDSIAVKGIALSKISSLIEFYQIMISPFANPSPDYLRAVSQLIVNRLEPFVNEASSIQDLNWIESLTVYVSESIAVKTIGLKACVSPDKFWALTEYVFENPSPAYTQAVNQFIEQYSFEYGR